MIEVTEEHKRQIPEWNRRWIEIIRSTEAIDRERVSDLIRQLYAAVDLKEPRVVYVPSPMVGAAVWAAASVFWETDAATGGATCEATYDATGGAFCSAIRASTDDAIYGATGGAIRSAILASTDGATRASTDEATHSATDEAIRSATFETTSVATRIAICETNSDATCTAIYDATCSAIRSATRDAIRSATRDAIRSATDDPFEIACEVVSGKLGRSIKKDAAEKMEKWHWPYHGGCEWASYCGFLSFFRDICGFEHESDAKYGIFESLAIESGPRFLHPEFCLICDRAETRRINEDGKLHCEFGPAIRWRCGTERFFLDGKKATQVEVRARAEAKGWHGGIDNELGLVIADWLYQAGDDANAKAMGYGS